MSMESSKAAEATQAGGSCNLDEVAENILREKWRAIGEVLTLDCNLTLCASTRRRGGDGFESQPKPPPN